MNHTLNYIVRNYNVQLGKEYFVDLPMQGSGELAKLFAKLGCTKGVEIGTDQGEYAEILCQANPYLKLYCVDPWIASAYDRGEQPESGEDQTFFDKRYQETVERLKPYDAVLIRKTYTEAVKDFADESLDFVYIDGNHDFVNVTQDIHYWLKKLKPGGIMSGHDYCYFKSSRFNHVKRVVQSYALSYHYLPVFAAQYMKKGLRRDRFRSWFFIKP